MAAVRTLQRRRCDWGGSHRQNDKANTGNGAVLNSTPWIMPGGPRFLPGRERMIRPMEMADRLLAEDAFDDDVFEAIELGHADLSKKEFTRCLFTKALLQECRLAGARFDDCTFTGCDLTRALLNKAAFRGVQFTNCRLMGIDWSPIAINPELSFEDCNLQYATFATNLTNTPFKSCRLVEVNFIDARLRGASFRGCDLSGARFVNCDMQEADFVEARGVLFDPAKNRVKDAQIDLSMAVLLAQSFGLRVNGFDEDRDKGLGTRRRRSARR